MRMRSGELASPRRVIQSKETRNCQVSTRAALAFLFSFPVTASYAFLEIVCRKRRTMRIDDMNSALLREYVAFYGVSIFTDLKILKYRQVIRSESELTTAS
jgi:hypothetical protein